VEGGFGGFGLVAERVLVIWLAEVVRKACGLSVWVKRTYEVCFVGTRVSVVAPDGCVDLASAVACSAGSLVAALPETS
jgi:hypothetical protein